MYVIDQIIEQEKKRNLEMQDAYQRKIAELPRGQLLVRTLNKGRKYCYLKYKQDGKTIAEYAGTVEVEDTLREQIARRKHFEAILSVLKKEYARMEKMEKVK